MNWRKEKLIFLIVFLIFISACITPRQPSNRVKFYTLEYDPPMISDLDPLPLVLKVERFSVAPTYNTNQIIYRDRSFKRDSYGYHKWRVNPGDMVTSFLNRDIKQSGLLKAVLSHESRFPSSYVLEGSVDEFYEWDAEESWKAVLSVSITLMVSNEPDISKKILFQKTYKVEDESAKKNPTALAEAMSRAMSSVSIQIINDIYSYLKDRV